MVVSALEQAEQQEICSPLGSTISTSVIHTVYWTWESKKSTAGAQKRTWFGYGGGASGCLSIHKSLSPGYVGGTRSSFQRIRSAAALGNLDRTTVAAFFISADTDDQSSLLQAMHPKKKYKTPPSLS